MPKKGRSHCQVLRPKLCLGGERGREEEDEEGGKSRYTVHGMLLRLWVSTVSSLRAGIFVSFVTTIFPTPRRELGT